MKDIQKAIFEPKELTCVECGNTFVFETGEQIFFISKGLTEPKRCPECRLKRKLTIVHPEGSSYE